MQFLDYYRGLSTAEKHAYAARAGTTHSYCYIHLQYAGKGASLDMLKRLVAAAEGNVSLEEMVEHFAPSDADETAAA